jgi:hypothetical protein
VRYILTKTIELFLNKPKLKVFIYKHFFLNTINSKAFQPKWTNSTGSPLYTYAANCDFPGDNIIEKSCQSTETDIACAKKCSENAECRAFLAVTTIDKPESKYWCCFKKETEEQPKFTKENAKRFDHLRLILESTCGIML